MFFFFCVLANEPPAFRPAKPTGEMDKWVMLFFSLFAMVMLHLQILQEEKSLGETFGEEYRRYACGVHRDLGRRGREKP